jgi:hypothetical protein
VISTPIEIEALILFQDLHVAIEIAFQILSHLNSLVNVAYNFRVLAQQFEKLLRTVATEQWIIRIGSDVARAIE